MALLAALAPSASASERASRDAEPTAPQTPPAEAASEGESPHRAVAAAAPGVDAAMAAVALEEAARAAGAPEARVVPAEGGDGLLLLEGVPPEVQADLVDEPSVRALQANRPLYPALASSTTKIGVPHAWDLGLTGQGQTIAVIDTGVLRTHPALSGAVVVEACFVPYPIASPADRCPNGQYEDHSAGAAAPPCTPDQRARQVSEACAHGTHVAGIAAGRATASGHQGVAPGASIAAVRIAAGDGSMDEASLLAALDWVIAKADQHQISVVNLSVSTSELFSGACDAQFPLWGQRISQLDAKGVAVVAATGNAKVGVTGRVGAPACLSGVIGVSATDLADGRAGFAHIASTTKLFAPGVDVVAPVPPAVQASGYRKMSGTSMAAPHVAGAIAVMREAQSAAHPVSHLVNVLRGTGRNVSTPVGTIPRIDVGAAVERPLAPARVAATHGNGRATVSWTAASPGIGGPITGYRITSVPSGVTIDVGPGVRSRTITGLRNGTRYQLRVQARNSSGLGRARTSNLVIPKAPAPAHGFVDVPAGSWYDLPVRWLKAERITGGVGGSNRYAPGDPVTRAQMAVFLWRLMGSPTGSPAHGFVDVPAGTYYDPAVRWLKARGITTGVGDTGRFMPHQPVSRAQMATFLHRLVRSPGGYGWHGFVDVPAGTYFDLPVRWLKATGLTTGVGGTDRYVPGDPVTRAQMATLLHRLAANPAAWTRVSVAAIPSSVIF